MHFCHMCISEDPRNSTSRLSGDKIVKCLRCPASYHAQTYCIPAGTEILSSTQIICPRHISPDERSKLKNGKYKHVGKTVNVTWCFICGLGGDIICCETCPTSVHISCLKIPVEDDRFICEECETGRLLLYDDVVWVKLGSYRWWPGLILFPNDVPDNILKLPHVKGEFVVKFFGSHDHYWVNRGRAFLYQDGDMGTMVNSKNKVDSLFARASKEAGFAFNIKKGLSKICINFFWWGGHTLP